MFLATYLLHNSQHPNRHQRNRSKCTYLNLLLFFLLTVAGTVPSNTASAVPGPSNYIFTNIEIPGELWGDAYLNDNGVISGSFVQPDGIPDPKIFIWDKGKSTTLLPNDISQGAQEVDTSAINNDVVLGTYHDTDGAIKSFIFEISTETMATFSYPDAYWTRFKDINNRGMAIGEIELAKGSARKTLLYNLNTGKTSLLSVFADQINDSGQMAGGLYDESTDKCYAFLWNDNQVRYQFNPDPLGLTCNITVQGLSNTGVIIGRYMDIIRSQPRADYYVGFVFKEGKTDIIDFASSRPPQLPWTKPLGVNDNGLVVGWRDIYDGVSDRTIHGGFVFQEGQVGPFDVPNAKSTNLFAVNNKGQILGDYYDQQGVWHLFLATPINRIIYDDFNRSDGKLGFNWSGATGKSAYAIINGHVDVRKGGIASWKPEGLGVNQETSLTVVTIDANAGEQDLLLKMQGKAGSYKKGAIAIRYNSAAGTVHVATWRKSSTEWTKYQPVGMSLVSGDKIGARVYSNGRIEIYRNEDLQDQITLNAADLKFFSKKGGRIGFWFKDAGSTEIDDFRGATLND